MIVSPRDDFAATADFTAVKQNTLSRRHVSRRNAADQFASVLIDYLIESGST
jgi:hypothetical protein